MQAGTTQFARVGGLSQCAASFSSSEFSPSPFSPLPRQREAAPTPTAAASESFEYAGLQAEQQGARRLGDDRHDDRPGGHRRPRRRLDRPRRDERRPGRQGRVDPDRPRRVPVRRHEPHLLRGHGRRLEPRSTSSSPRTSAPALAHASPSSRWPAGTRLVARLGRRQARQPADLPAGQPRDAGTRRPSPRTGTAARAPATPTPTASRTSTLAQASGGAWQPLQGSSQFQDPGYHVVPISNSPRSFLAASLAA